MNDGGNRMLGDNNPCAPAKWPSARDDVFAL